MEAAKSKAQNQPQGKIVQNNEVTNTVSQLLVGELSNEAPIV